MAYPILHNLTQSIADKLEALIECAQNMTRGKYSSLYAALAASWCTRPRNSARQCATTAKTYAATRTSSTITNTTSRLSSPRLSSFTSDC